MCICLILVAIGNSSRFLPYPHPLSYTARTLTSLYQPSGESEGIKIGSSGKVVKIDETVIIQGKYKRGYI